MIKKNTESTNKPLSLLVSKGEEKNAKLKEKEKEKDKKKNEKKEVVSPKKVEKIEIEEIVESSMEGDSVIFLLFSFDFSLIHSR